MSNFNNLPISYQNHQKQKMVNIPKCSFTSILNEKSQTQKIPLAKQSHSRMNSEIVQDFTKQRTKIDVPENTPQVQERYKKNTKKQISCAGFQQVNILQESAVWTNTLNDQCNQLSNEYSTVPTPSNQIIESSNRIRHKSITTATTTSTLTNYTKSNISSKQTLNTTQNEDFIKCSKPQDQNNISLVKVATQSKGGKPSLPIKTIQLTQKSDYTSQPMSYLLSERQNQQETQIVSKKNTQRCVSLDYRYQPVAIQTPDLSFLCNEEIDLTDLQLPEDQPGSFNQDTLQYLMISEQEYEIDQFYLRNHLELNPTTRAILMDWIMEVCSELHLKRETFHLSITYVDKFLSKTFNITKQLIQLVGIVSLQIASKIEEIYPPSTKKFAEAANNGFTEDQIIDMEIRILQTLKFQMTPPTIIMWLNWYCGQWDLFTKNKNAKFKQANEESYQLYRFLCQMVDLSVLDIDTLRFKPRQLLTAFMYLILAVKHNFIKIKNILDQVSIRNYFLQEQIHPFNIQFAEFSRISFGFNLVDLFPCIQFCQQFFSLTLNFDLPIGIHDQQNIIEGHYEEFLSFQTHNVQNLSFLKKKNKQRDQINYNS